MSKVTKVLVATIGLAVAGSMAVAPAISAVSPAGSHVHTALDTGWD